MREPSSFSTICTKTCKQELIGFLLSLSLHHPNANTYVICDTETKAYIDSSTPKPKLNIKWYIELDDYSKYNRAQMEARNIFGKFLSFKMKCMKYALQECMDSMFVDSDTIILDRLYIEDGYEIGLSPQFIQQKYVERSGYYNAGLLWTNTTEALDHWEEVIDHKHSCAEQINMDKLRKFKYFEFDENYNLQTWRFVLGIEPGQQIASYVNVRDDKIYYRDEPLKFIHTHFNTTEFRDINSFFVKKLAEARRYRELSIIYRVINNAWVLQIPKQPMKGIWKHNNDSYRELALLMKVNNKDVDIELSTTSGHCWLKPNILTYDRPTLEWYTDDINLSSLILLGNGSIEDEGEQLKHMNENIDVRPWIFWARRPMILEKVLKTSNRTPWSGRTNDSIFIGNFENSTQKKFRQTNYDWGSVLSEYHCTSGSKHKFTQQEYLDKLRTSKYGLCLRGYGSKCHREVELMALGTVPLITSEVSISSYYDQPIEGIHYFKVSTPEELNEIVESTQQETWEKMSSACYEWYQRNIYSSNAWNTMITHILYDD